MRHLPAELAAPAAVRWVGQRVFARALATRAAARNPAATAVRRVGLGVLALTGAARASTGHVAPTAVRRVREDVDALAAATRLARGARAATAAIARIGVGVRAVAVAAALPDSASRSAHSAVAGVGERVGASSAATCLTGSARLSARRAVQRVDGRVGARATATRCPLRTDGAARAAMIWVRGRVDTRATATALARVACETAATAVRRRCRVDALAAAASRRGSASETATAAVRRVRRDVDARAVAERERRMAVIIVIHAEDRGAARSRHEGEPEERDDATRAHASVLPVTRHARKLVRRRCVRGRARIPCPRALADGATLAVLLGDGADSSARTTEVVGSARGASIATIRVPPSGNAEAARIPRGSARTTRSAATRSIAAPIARPTQRELRRCPRWVVTALKVASFSESAMTAAGGRTLSP